MPTLLDNALNIFDQSIGSGLIVLLFSFLIIVAIFTALIRPIDV